MENMNRAQLALLIERLQSFEYSIRQSITVREDQDEDALPPHREEAQALGISSDAAATKGDLLNAVQTLLRSLQGRFARE